MSWLKNVLILNFWITSSNLSKKKHKILPNSYALSYLDISPRVDVAYKGLNIHWASLGCVILFILDVAYKGLTIYWERLGCVSPLYQIVASKRIILVKFQMNYSINKIFQSCSENEQHSRFLKPPLGPIFFCPKRYKIFHNFAIFWFHKFLKKFSKLLRKLREITFPKASPWSNIF